MTSVLGQQVATLGAYQTASTAASAPFPTAAIMVQGTGSHVGKTLLVSGLCRWFARAGIRVAPFKPQNMSNNAAVTADGGEIGRSTALQALACHQAPDRRMNPVLLKPQAGGTSQVVVNGRPYAHAVSGRDYLAMKRTLRPMVMDAFHALARTVDLVVVEGAGSPAETNLRRNDIANMGFALGARVPVMLVGDIDRGGVIASLVGTWRLLRERERDLVRGFCINRFRGDVSLFDPAIPTLKAHMDRLPCWGVIRWWEPARLLPDEDSMGWTDAMHHAKATCKDAHPPRVTVVVPTLPFGSNLDDLAPLRQDARIRLVVVDPQAPWPANVDLVILPGSKAVMHDLRVLQQHGWQAKLRAHVEQGGGVLGVCGGYQMLGTRITDPLGLEGQARGATQAGFGLLPIETTMQANKTVTRMHGHHIPTGAPIEGYRMHHGHTVVRNESAPTQVEAFLRTNADRTATDSLSHGMRCQRVWGTYWHGVLANRALMTHVWHALKGEGEWTSAALPSVDALLDDLADHLAESLDLAAVARAALTRRDDPLARW